jgi:adenylate kinase family enzyme
MRIHITGASGSGVSTLGKNLSSQLGIPQFECDDFYWEKTNPPFQRCVPRPARMVNLFCALKPHSQWILSGSQDSWSDPFEELYTHIIYLSVPAEVRVERLKKREIERWQDRVLQGGDMHEDHLKFLEWAKQYDEGYLSGRSRPRHLEWLQRQKCPIIKIEGTFSEAEALDYALKNLSC